MNKIWSVCIVFKMLIVPLYSASIEKIGTAVSMTFYKGVFVKFWERGDTILLHLSDPSNPDLFRDVIQSL